MPIESTRTIWGPFTPKSPFITGKLHDPPVAFKHQKHVESQDESFLVVALSKV